MNEKKRKSFTISNNSVSKVHSWPMALMAHDMHVNKYRTMKRHGSSPLFYGYGGEKKYVRHFGGSVSEKQRERRTNGAYPTSRPAVTLTRGADAKLI